MCRLRNSSTRCDRRADRQTDGRTTDKVIPKCRYASKATQKLNFQDFYICPNILYADADVDADAGV